MEIKYLNFSAFLILLIPLSLIILSVISVKVRVVSPILNEIRSSLNDYPLSEFEYAEDCYDKYSGNLYTFPGSQLGCSCTHISYYYNDQSGKYLVNVGKCSYNQSDNGCEEVPKVNSQKLQNWDYGKFCSKSYQLPTEIKGYLYYLNLSVLENEECQKGYKKCGKLDDMGNYLCLPENDECPINDIIVSSRLRDDLANYNYTIVNGKFYYYTNISDKPVISKLKVVEGKMCMDRTYYYTEYPQYVLDNNFKKYGCRHKIDKKIYDDNIEILDTKTKKEFYSDSGVNMKFYYYRSYFDFPFYSLNAQMNLYPQRYLGYDKKCLIQKGAFDVKNSPFNEEKISEIDSIVTDVIYKNKINLWFSIACLIVTTLCTCFLPAFDGKIRIIWNIINGIFFIMMAIPIILNLKKVPKLKNLPACGDNITNLKINYYNSTSNTLKATTIISFIFVCLYIIFNIILLLINVFWDLISSGDYSNKKESLINKQNNSSNIDYQKAPEDPYYTSSDFQANNGPFDANNATPQAYDTPY